MTPGNGEKLYGWVMELGQVDYQRALAWQRQLVKLRREGLVRDTIIMLEHPPVVTVGRDGHPENYCNLTVPPVYVERGGDVTYHGPGQLVVYFVFDLARRQRDVHRFMAGIQSGIVGALARIGIEAAMGEEHTGVWVTGRKIASIGVAVKHWISFHGAAVNLNTRLSDFAGICPCGLNAEVMTSAAEVLGREVDEECFRRVLLEMYGEVFGVTFEPITLEFLAEDIESQSGGNVI
jgi:lipoyl(octanoyl) transferase